MAQFSHINNSSLWKKLLYLLNPEKNLANTEKRLKPFFLQNKGWKGYIGTAPEKEQLASLFKSSSSYL